MDLRTVEAMAEAAIAEHLPNTRWRMRWDNAVKRAGQCQYGTKTISLSRKLMALWDEAEVRDTILHEVAHAMCPGDGHGAAWKRTCLVIGARPERCYSGDQPQVDAPWTGVCPNGHEKGGHRRPKRVSSCGRCSRRFSPSTLIAWSHHGQRQTPEQIGAAYAREWRMMEDRWPDVRGLSWPGDVEAGPLAAVAQSAPQEPRAPRPEPTAYVKQGMLF